MAVDEALKTKSAKIVEQSGRRMGGLIFVEADSLTDADVKVMMKLAMQFVASLPAK